MTADSSAIIIDTSQGQKNTQLVLQEQVEHLQQLEGTEVKNETSMPNRAQTALLMR